MKTNNKFGITSVSLFFLIAWMCLPLYRHLSSSHGIQSNEELPYNLITALSFIFVISTISFFFNLIGSKATKIIAIVLYSVALLSYALTESYSIITQQNLGADLFGYSIKDILLTASSSVSLKIDMIAFFTLVLIFFVSTSVFIKAKDSILRLTITMTLSLIGFIITFIHVQRATDLQNENKLLSLLSDIKRVKNNYTEPLNVKGFPFLNEFDFSNPWKEYIEQTDTPPNFVFVIVEGLGGDFVSNGKYAGFTPFLDSLIQQSLYWKNGLSNAGRTFGAMPSIFGSLPYGESGFMNLGQQMPQHQTLFTLLKSSGYQTNFFYGGNPNFDNLDLFLERQTLDQFINSSNFPNSIKQSESNKHWGYADEQLFLVGTESIKNKTGPRMDCYLTLSTHEPFECPDLKIKKLADALIEKKQGDFSANKNIFECLYYTDNALRKMFAWYNKRTDFKNTIFIITGDHRLIPMDNGNRLSRHHVPILVYSKLIKQPKTFSSLAIHSSITPSVVGYLASEFHLRFPAQLPFISKPLSTDTFFTSNLDLPLIRVKNSVADYISGKDFLSEGELYEISDILELKRAKNETLKKKLVRKLNDFQSKSEYVLKNNKLDSTSRAFTTEFLLTEYQKSIEQKENLVGMSPDQMLSKARGLAYAKQYTEAGVILKVLLNQSPNYHDTRLLLARTYAWQNKYDSAMHLVNQTLKKSPQYADAYVLWSDIEYWQGNSKASLKISEDGLQWNATDSELKQRRARALHSLLEAKASQNNLIH
ncbi:MAG TPA: hypothetical protein DGG95_06565 [Cytophagales bacterium]|nr:hypothetical protein [Cytophagales bacterium]